MCTAGARCGSTPPTQPPPPTLTVTCPQKVEVDSATGDPIPAEFGQPTATGGVGAVNTVCTPASGTIFNPGTTAINCIATDTRGVTASCSTSVFVRVPPKLVGSKFMAFGDSITSGKFSNPLPITSITESPFAYPEQLLPLLQARYRLQQITMVNEGGPGDMAHVEGVAKFRPAMLRNRPEIVLLMMGTNDLLVAQGVDRAMDGLRQIVTQARAAEFNARVVIATVPPQRSGAPRPPGVPELVPVLNERIRTFATAEHLPLADVYAAMQGNLSLIGVDNLHPTPQGFKVIADTFFQTIQKDLEVTPPAVTSLR